MVTSFFKTPVFIVLFIVTLALGYIVIAKMVNKAGVSIGKRISQ
jgi:hypothetical protein